MNTGFKISYSIGISVYKHRFLQESISFSQPRFNEKSSSIAKGFYNIIAKDWLTKNIKYCLNYEYKI